MSFCYWIHSMLQHGCCGARPGRSAVVTGPRLDLAAVSLTSFGVCGHVGVALAVPDNVDTPWDRPWMGGQCPQGQRVGHTSRPEAIEVTLPSSGSFVTRRASGGVTSSGLSTIKGALPVASGVAMPIDVLRSACSTHQWYRALFGVA